MRRALYDPLLLAAFCGFLFFFGLGAFGLTGADEPRYAQIAREMLARHDWVVPTLNGAPWLEKPILYYWEAMIAYRLFGVSDSAARIPSAFSATLLVFAVWRFAQRELQAAASGRLAGETPAVQGLDAALITASSAAVIGFARGASTDMPLAANFCIALLCWFRWYETGMGRWLLAFYGFMALATLAKGPVAPGLAALIILAFVCLRREPRFILRTLWWPGVLLFFAIAVPWFLLVEQRTGTFFRIFFLEHNLARFATDTYRHRQPFWYYVPVLLASLGPWMIYGVAAFVESFRTVVATMRNKSAPEPLTPFLLLWGTIPIIFFSLSQSKLPGYILPAIPAWTLLLAHWLGDQTRNQQRQSRVLLVAHGLWVGLLLFAVAVLPYRLLGLTIPKAGLLLAGVCAAAACVGVVWTVYANGLRLLRFATLVPIVIAVALILRVDAPALDAKLSARPLAQEIARSETSPLPVAVFGVSRQVEYGLNFYRAHAIATYDRGEMPAGEHIVAGRGGTESGLRERAGDRRVVKLADYAPQKLEIWWVGRPGSAAMTHQH